MVDRSSWGSGERCKGTRQSATAGSCSIFSIQLPRPSALTNGDFRRQYPWISRFSPMPLDPLPLDFEYFTLGVLNVVKTSRRPPSWRGATTKTDTRAYRPGEWHAVGRRVVRRHDVVLTEGAGCLYAPTATRHPVDRVQGTSYGGPTRVGICRRPRGVIVGSRVENMLAYPKSSSSFTDKLFKETGAMQTGQNLG